VRKKPNRIIMVSLSMGRAEMSAVMSTLRPLILEIVRRGLATLNALILDALKPPESSSGPTYALSSPPPTDNKLVITIMKSITFHQSRR
jgi:hypothetical protein